MGGGYKIEERVESEMTERRWLEIIFNDLWNPKRAEEGDEK